MATRRELIGVASTLALNSLLGGSALARSQGESSMSNPAPDVIYHNGRITTLDRARPLASAVAVKDGRFVAVGDDAEVMALALSLIHILSEWLRLTIRSPWRNSIWCTSPLRRMVRRLSLIHI